MILTVIVLLEKETNGASSFWVAKRGVDSLEVLAELIIRDEPVFVQVKIVHKNCNFFFCRDI